MLLGPRAPQNNNFHIKIVDFGNGEFEDDLLQDEISLRCYRCPENILNEHSENACTIPMINKNVRSLNLATSVGIVLYEAIRQINEK